MSAKHGLTRSIRLLGCLMAVSLLASALFASAASAKKPEPTNPTVYINMGDSVSYGYTQEKFILAKGAGDPPSAFEGGYPNLLGAKLAKKEAKLNNKLALINLACPGENSKGLIGNGPIAEALTENFAKTKFSGGEAPCGWHNKLGLERHYEFGEVSQLEAAVGIIKSGAQVSDVTLQIGSNDELKKLGECASEAYRTAHGFSSFIECVQEEAKNVLFPTIVNNIGLTIAVLRENGYTGPVGVLGFYNPQAFLLAGSDPLQKSLNEAMEATIKGGLYGAKVAFGNPFKKTNPQGKKTETPEQRQALEKAAVCLYTEECNMFDKKIEYEKITKAPATAAEVEEAEKTSGKMIPGDIHPTTAGDELFGKLLGSALKKA
jgi:hypothetical protein